MSTVTVAATTHNICGMTWLAPYATHCILCGLLSTTLD